jgi:uncharacterized membrane protein YeiH
MIYFLDIFGTFIFALTGAIKAVKYELDIFGVTILSIATGIGGGMIRDIIIGSTPPAALKHEEYLLICIAAAFLVFFTSRMIAERWDIIMFFDAVGLGVFTVIGAAKGMDAGLGIVGIIMTGTMTATGGGLIRDLLANEIPTILKKDFYATATIIGGILFIVLNKLNIETNLLFLFTFITTTGIRLLAMKLNIKLPAVKSLKASPSELSKQHREKKGKSS